MATLATTETASVKKSTHRCLSVELGHLREEAGEKGESRQVSKQPSLASALALLSPPSTLLTTHSFSLEQAVWCACRDMDLGQVRCGRWEYHLFNWGVSRSECHSHLIVCRDLLVEDKRRSEVRLKVLQQRLDETEGKKRTWVYIVHYLLSWR